MQHNIEIVLENKNAMYITAILQDGISPYTKKTKESFLQDGYIVLPDKEAMKLVFENEEQEYLKEWTEITEDQWYEALEVLPPMRWSNVNRFEFFFCEEAWTGNIHSCYCSVDGKYFTAKRRTTTSYQEMIDELKGENHV